MRAEMEVAQAFSQISLAIRRRCARVRYSGWYISCPEDVVDVLQAPGVPVLLVADAAVLQDEIGDPRTSPVSSSLLKTVPSGMCTLNGGVFVICRCNATYRLVDPLEGLVYGLVPVVVLRCEPRTGRKVCLYERHVWCASP